MAQEDYSSDDGWGNQTGIQETFVPSQYGEHKPSLWEWPSDFPLTPIEETELGRTVNEVPFTWDDIQRNAAFNGNRVSDLPIPTEAKLRAEMPEEILESYGVKVVFPNKHGKLFFIFRPSNPSLLPILNDSVIFTEVEVATQKMVKKKLARCLTLYPRDFFKKRNINTIYVANMREGLMGFYVQRSKDIVLSPASFTEEYGSGVTFHHELNHLLEHQTPEGKRFKKNWERKFPRINRLMVLLGILSGKSLSENVQVYKGKRYEKLEPIFLDGMHFDPYASHSPEEDRSVTMEQLFSDPEKRDRKKDFPRIKKEKIDLAMTFLGELDDRMNVKFWADYAEGKVDSNYWRTRS